MTHNEAGKVIMLYVKAYPTQARDEVFQSMLAAALAPLPFTPTFIRASNWIVTERFWPSIAEASASFEVQQRPTKLIAPADPMPSDRGLEIFRQAMIGD